ncbi:MAG TPA: biotin--[acetyl-CoA-carboxylase] ligase [Nitrolancea sp.]|nr:biotin--[acetyl-CoA-carboxylase] ligase [Nitrolancea sp.]
MSSREADILTWRIRRIDEVTSTMDEAAELARDDAPVGTVVVASNQSNGRGRGGHTWIAPAGTSLLATVIFRPELSVVQDESLSRKIGERVRDAIAEVTGLWTTVKEPNDLLYASRKLCGILCQTSVRGKELEYLLVGIGINANIPDDQLPLETATSLLAETGFEVDLHRLLVCVLGHIAEIPGLADLPE